MHKAKAWRLVQSGPIYAVDYCVDGMHVSEVGDGGIAIAPRYKVTPCDKSCEGKPISAERDLSDKMVEKLRGMLNQGTGI